MKITQVEAVNFCKHIRTVIDIPETAKVALIAAPNGAGKSSILQGIRMAFTGEADRGIKHKNEVPKLLRHGETGGMVKVTTSDGVWSLDIKRVVWKAPDGISPGIVLGGKDYFDLDDAGRKKALFSVAGISLKPSDVVADLLKMGHDSSLCARVCESMRLGFEAAAIKADALASEARGMWQAVTGERYGAVKAAAWTAPRPSLSNGDPKVMERRIASLKAEVSALSAKHKAMAADLLAAQKLDAAGEMPDVPMLQQKQGDCEKRLSECKAVMDGAKAAIAAESSHGWDAECPNCGTKLHSDGPGKLAVAQSGAVDVGEHTKIVAKMQSEMSDLNEELAYVRKMLAHAAAISSIRGNISNPPSQDEVDASAREVIDRQTDLDKVSAELTEHNRQVTALAACDGLTRKAFAAHESVEAATKLADSVRALPSKYLSDAIMAVNEHLAPIASAANATLTLDQSLSASYNGVDYAICSESEQWILSMGMACALAKLSNAGIVLIDRLDVLDPARRGRFLKYLAGQPFQTIIAGTLKERPSLSPEFSVHWLGE